MSSSHRWISLGIVSTALLMIVVDLTVLYTALPSISQDLAATASEKLWIVNAYALTVAGLLPAMGALTDKFGPRPMLRAGLVVFGAASLIAAFSPSSALLIASRVVLAIGAALMMPATLSVIRHIFEDARERSLALGIWSAISAGGAAFGPVLGGILLAKFWWGSVFLINIPVVLLALLGTVLVLPSIPGEKWKRIDLVGAVEIVIGLSALIFAIKELSQADISVPSAAASAIISVLALTLFYRRQRTALFPMLDTALFRDAVFTAAVVASLVSSAALIGSQYVISQHFQLFGELSPLQAGLAILPVPLAAFVGGPIAGALLPRVGVTRMLWMSMAGSALGMAAFAFLHSNTFFGGLMLALLGASLGGTLTAASAAILGSAPAHSSGSVASIEEVSYEFGGAIGVAILGSLLASVYSSTIVPPAEGGNIARAIDSFDGAIAVAGALDTASANALLEAARAAFEHSFLWALTVGSVSLAITAAIIAGLRLDRQA